MYDTVLWYRSSCNAMPKVAPGSRAQADPARPATNSMPNDANEPTGPAIGANDREWFLACAEYLKS